MMEAHAKAIIAVARDAYSRVEHVVRAHVARDGHPPCHPGLAVRNRTRSTSKGAWSLPVTEFAQTASGPQVCARRDLRCHRVSRLIRTVIASAWDQGHTQVRGEVCSLRGKRFVLGNRWRLPRHKRCSSHGMRGNRTTDRGCSPAMIAVGPPNGCRAKLKGCARSRCLPRLARRGNERAEATE